MVKFNFLVVLVAALIPLIVGSIWYNPKIFGNNWLASAGMTPDKEKTGNMPLIFGLSFLFSVFLSIALQFFVIHQFHIGSIVMNEPALKDPNSELSQWIKVFFEKYGQNFRTFKHGAFHGIIAGIFIALPVLGINALFEQRGFKYIAIHTGYWTITMALMGGILCAYV